MISEQGRISGRKKRKAKREYRKNPVFALDAMQQEFGLEYTESDLWRDLKPSRKKKSFRTKKNPMRQYGRYSKIQDLLASWQHDKEIVALHRAQKLLHELKNPIRVRITRRGKGFDLVFDGTCSLYQIESAVSKFLETKMTLRQAVAFFETEFKESVSFEEIPASEIGLFNV